MIYTPTVKAAIKLCFEVHGDQVDKCGIPYANHPLHLAEQMHSEDEICVALLHDVMEDSEKSPDDLREIGVSERAIEALLLLTHDKDVPYLDYVRALKDNEIARKVKIADLRHNSEVARLDRVKEKDLRRLRKYMDARILLGDMAYELETPVSRVSVEVNGKPYPFTLEDESRKAYTVFEECAGDAESKPVVGKPDKTFALEIETLPLVVGDTVHVIYDFGTNIMDWGSDERIYHKAYAKDGYTIGIGLYDDESLIDGESRHAFRFNRDDDSYEIVENPVRHRVYPSAHRIGIRIAWKKGVSEANAQIVGWVSGF